MVFTTTVVNAHALSHLFDNEDFSAVELCKTCDEYVLTNQEDIHFITPTLPELTFQGFDSQIESTVSVYKVYPKRVHKSGKYYNKPPPFKLA